MADEVAADKSRSKEDAEMEASMLTPEAEAVKTQLQALQHFASSADFKRDMESQVSSQNTALMGRVRRSIALAKLEQPNVRLSADLGSSAINGMKMVDSMSFAFPLRVCLLCSLAYVTN